MNKEQNLLVSSKYRCSVKKVIKNQLVYDKVSNIAAALESLANIRYLSACLQITKFLKNSVDWLFKQLFFAADQLYVYAFYFMSGSNN